MSLFENNFYSGKTILRQFSLKNSHIGYQNLISSVSASSSAASFGTSALLNGFTYDFWRSADSFATLILDTGDTNALDYVGIAKHNLAGREIIISSSIDGTTYTQREVVTLISNDAAMIIFNEIDARYIKLEISSQAESFIYADFIGQEYYLGADYVQISVLSAGKSLEMQRMIFGGHSPAKLGREAEIRPNTSEGGAWLGRSIIRQGAQCEYSYSNLEGNWYRAYFDPFAAHALTKPFFIAWRPFGYANECQYAWTDKPIKPANIGTNNWLSVSFSVIGCD